MNNKRRSIIKRALSLIEEAENYVRVALDEEIDSLGNMPENLEASDRYVKMDETVSNLEDAMDNMAELRSFLETAIERQ